MAQGQFEKRRRRRRRRSPLPMFILTAVLIFGLILMLTMCNREDEKDPAGESTVQTTTAEADLPEETTTAPVIDVVTTAPPVETTAAPTTEPATEPTTEPTTDPTPEPTTEPTTDPTEAEDEPASSLGDRVAELATDLVGSKYEYGGSGPKTFDTSGLVYYCFQENDVDVPRALSKQAKFGEKVSKEDLQPGDVLFFWTSEEGKVQYVGIYIGGGEFVAARNSEKPVSILGLNTKYFTERFLFARRFTD